MPLIQVGDQIIVDVDKITAVYAAPDGSEKTIVSVDQGGTDTNFVSPWSFANVVRALRGQQPEEEVVDGEIIGEEVEK